MKAWFFIFCMLIISVNADRASAQSSGDSTQLSDFHDASAVFSGESSWDNNMLSSGEISADSSGDYSQSSGEVGSGVFPEMNSGDQTQQVFLPYIMWPPQCVSDGVASCINFTGSFSFRGCYCDSICVPYEDCCVDYGFKISSSHHGHQFECVNVRPQFKNSLSNAQDRYIKVVSSCPSSWKYAPISSNCLSNDGLIPPVTDPSTNVTYKNIFCARCHGVTNVSSWSVTFLCPNSSQKNVTMSYSELQKNCMGINFLEPPSSQIRECFYDEVISICPSYDVSSSYYNESVSFDLYSTWVNKCSSYQRLVVANYVVYKNEYCALCQGQQSTKLFEQGICDIITISLVTDPIVNVNVTMDFFTISIVPAMSSSELNISCGKGQLFDGKSMMCRNVITPVGVDGFNNSCTNNLNLTLTCNCTSLIALNESEFTFAGNNTVVFNGEVFSIQFNTSVGQPVICVNWTQNGTIVTVRSFYVYPVGYDIVTYVGCSLSCIGCCLVLLTFCLFKDLRTLSTKILINITITILATDILVLLTVSRAIHSSGLCQAIAILLHFSTLAQFTWMTIMCVEMAHTFYLASRLIQVNTEQSCCKLIFYSIIAWSVPSVIVGISIVLNYTTSDFIKYGWNSLVESRSCWINDFYSLIVVFFIPIAMSTILQLVLYIVVGIFLCFSSKNKAKDSVRGTSTPFFRILLAIFFATNIKWAFGFIALLINAEWAWYLFTILLSIQGLVLFVGFFGTKKVFKLYVSTVSRQLTPITKRTTF